MEKDKFIGTHDDKKMSDYVDLKKTEEGIELNIKKRKLEDGTETGLHNWKNLFKKPSVRDWMDLIIIILAISLYFIYKYETGLMLEALNNCLQNKPII